MDLGDLKQPWLDWCAVRGEVPSQVMRTLVAKHVGTSAIAPVVQAVGQRDGRRVRYEIRLTSSEADISARLAAADGFSVPRWLAALARARATRAPQLGQMEQELLGESNYQLLAIGRNLNQIAKALNATPDNRTAYDAELIEQLRQFIQRHVVKVSAVIEANLERWQLHDK